MAWREMMLAVDHVTLTMLADVPPFTPIDVTPFFQDDARKLFLFDDDDLGVSE